jgi:hypothetical protein
MHYYGESDYWVAQYRSMTEGSTQQIYAAEKARRGLVVRSITLVTALFSSVTRRGVEKKAGLDGRA